MTSIIPSKLHEGDIIRVVAPARSLALLSDTARAIADANLSTIGLAVTFGAHVGECDTFQSSSVESRVADLHAAFRDTAVKAVFSVIGGFNSNQLLRSIDWELVRANPKILCGFSDITALGNALFAKTGIVTYSGPHYSTFGQKQLSAYNIEYVQKCLFADEPFEVFPSDVWTDDKWYKDQDDRHPRKNEGWWTFNDGDVSGILFGGNLATMRLLYGTEYMPDLTGSVLFIEDDHYTDNDVSEFDRNLQSLIHQDGFPSVRGLVIGRFQVGSTMSRELLTEIIASKNELAHMPIIANVDFGHTDPLITFPVGGEVRLCVAKGGATITVMRH